MSERLNAIDTVEAMMAEIERRQKAERSAADARLQAEQAYLAAGVAEMKARRHFRALRKHPLFQAAADRMLAEKLWQDGAQERAYREARRVIFDEMVEHGLPKEPE